MSMFSIAKAGLALLTVCLTVGVAEVRAHAADSEQISRLLNHARTNAMQAEFDAETLDSFTRSSLSWQSHAGQLNLIRQHVNELGKTMAQMNSVRAEGSPWQQTAIDRINPLLRDMADQLTTTLAFLKSHEGQVNMPPYQEYARANYELASRTANVINDLVAYGQAKSNSNAIQHRLELPPRS